MEAEEIHTCKKSWAGASGNGSGGAWNNPASRIYRVSRASGGKDRHSKVYTVKGLRDRRVRLSVSSAIHLYDLQDRLGFDQPSKTIAWLIKAAAGAIAELPALESSFPDASKEVNFVLEMEAEDDCRNFNGTNSGSSSTPETTKASVLSISQSEICVKARQCATEEKDLDGGINQRVDSRSSFTELLNGDSGGGNCGIVTVAETGSRKQNCYLQGTATANYFAQGGVFSQLQKSDRSSSCSGLTALGSSCFPMNMVTFNTGAAAVATQGSGHSEMQHFSFMQDRPVPLAAVAAGDDFNLNFSLSPGLAGFNRETLQSNSSESQLHHHRHNHLSYPIDGSKIPFFGATSAAAASESQSQFLDRIDGGLQLYYGEGCRHSDLNC